MDADRATCHPGCRLPTALALLLLNLCMLLPLDSSGEFETGLSMRKSRVATSLQ